MEVYWYPWPTTHCWKFCDNNIWCTLREHFKEALRKSKENIVPKSKNVERMMSNSHLSFRTEKIFFLIWPRNKKKCSVIERFTIVQNKILTPSTSAIDSETSNYTNATNSSQIAQFNWFNNYKIIALFCKRQSQLELWNISNAKILNMQSELVVTNIPNTNSSSNTTNYTHNNTNGTSIILLAILIIIVFDFVLLPEEQRRSFDD